MQPSQVRADAKGTAERHTKRGAGTNSERQREVTIREAVKVYLAIHTVLVATAEGKRDHMHQVTPIRQAHGLGRTCAYPRRPTPCLEDTQR